MANRESQEFKEQMKPYSAYQETLDEQAARASRPSDKPAPCPATQIPLLLPASGGGVHSATSQSGWRPSLVPDNNFDFAHRVQLELDKLDSHVSSMTRLEIEKAAIAEIQKNCHHSVTRTGTKRNEDGSWYVGDICDFCEAMINPFKQPLVVPERMRRHLSRTDRMIMDAIARDDDTSFDTDSMRGS